MHSQKAVSAYFTSRLSRCCLLVLQGRLITQSTHHRSNNSTTVIYLLNFILSYEYLCELVLLWHAWTGHHTNNIWRHPTRRWANVVLLLAHHLRRWSKWKTTLGQRLVLAGIWLGSISHECIRHMSSQVAATGVNHLRITPRSIMASCNRPYHNPGRYQKIPHFEKWARIFKSKRSCFMFSFRSKWEFRFRMECNFEDRHISDSRCHQMI